jgi:hypothetical protein
VKVNQCGEESTSRMQRTQRSHLCTKLNGHDMGWLNIGARRHLTQTMQQARTHSRPRKILTSSPIALLVCLAFLSSCGAPEPTFVGGKPAFRSYDEAIRYVTRSGRFSCENVDTSKSSMVRSATFCTDGSEIGYAIFNLNGRNYIHAEVPRSLWQEFKKADSFGRFYIHNFRGRYRLGLHSNP